MLLNCVIDCQRAAVPSPRVGTTQEPRPYPTGTQGYLRMTPEWFIFHGEQNTNMPLKCFFLLLTLEQFSISEQEIVLRWNGHMCYFSSHLHFSSCWFIRSCQRLVQDWSALSMARMIISRAPLKNWIAMRHDAFISIHCTTSHGHVPCETEGTIYHTIK